MAKSLYPQWCIVVSTACGQDARQKAAEWKRQQLMMPSSCWHKSIRHLQGSLNARRQHQVVPTSHQDAESQIEDGVSVSRTSQNERCYVQQQPSWDKSCRALCWQQRLQRLQQKFTYWYHVAAQNADYIMHTIHHVRTFHSARRV
jgi:hypothetical protein